MKNIKSITICIILIANSICAISQENLKNNLKKHIYALADDSLMGRPKGSEAMRTAEDYVIRELRAANVKVEEYVLDNEDSESISTYKEISPRTIFAYVEGSDLKDEWIFIKADMMGQGYEIIDKNYIINNGANTHLSCVAAIIEMAKMFSKEKNNRRSIGFLLTNESSMMYFEDFSDIYLIEDIINTMGGFNNLKICIDLYSIGRFSRATLSGGYTEMIMNLQDILAPMATRDDLFIDMERLYPNEYGMIPRLRLTSFTYNNDDELLAWADEPNTIMYDTMTEAVKYIKELATVLANTEKIEITDTYLKPSAVAVYDDDDDFIDSVSMADMNMIPVPDDELERYVSFFNKPYSYFGISGLVGSNSHHYSEGSMTGKQSWAFAGGVFGKLAFSRYCGLSLGVNYQHLKAWRHDGKFSSNSIGVPLSFLFGRDVREAGINFSIGGYYDYIFNGEIDGSKLDFSQFSNHEIGMQFGVQLHLKKIMFSFYAKYGLTNVMTDKTKDNMQSITSFFQLSYLF